MFHIQSPLLRVCFSLISIIGFIIFVIPAFRGIINFGNVFGMAVFFILAVFFIFNKFFSEILLSAWHTSFGKIAITAILALAVIGIVLVSFISIAMCNAASKNPPSDNNTTVIVLGCKVSGSNPSLMLQRRLDTAYDYLKENPNLKVIVSGGQGDNEDVSEAECMKKYLVDKGISSKRIYKEDTSTSTYENIKNSLKIIKNNGLNPNVTIITDAFHQLRAALISKDLNIKNVYAVSAHTPIWLAPTYWVREWFGVSYQTTKSRL